LFKDRLDLFAGELDPTNYFDRNAFANDETSQFLDAALVNNPMLKQPPNGPGLVTRWDANRDLGFSLGAMGSREFEGAMFDGPFVAGEIDYHSARLSMATTVCGPAWGGSRTICSGRRGAWGSA
jgi:hypothetical protein